MHLSEQYFVLVCSVPQVGHILYCFFLLGVFELLLVAEHDLLQYFGFEVSLLQTAQECNCFLDCFAVRAHKTLQYFFGLFLLVRFGTNEQWHWLHVSIKIFIPNGVDSIPYWCAK